MAREHILIVEDEEDIRELMRYNLSREGYTVTEAGTGEKGIRLAREKKPELVILDLMLPGIDGLEVCRTLRNDDALKSLAIVIVTAKGEEPDIVTGLELGADDYVTKPFSPRVLIARVRAVLRRKAGEETNATEDSIIQREGMKIHPGRHEVIIDNDPVDLTYTEFKILHLLARRPGWVFTRYQIVDAVRGEDHPVSDRSVDVQIVGLRKKLGRYADLIETVRGVGYRFKE
ncbi:response regulator transcription factor [bacterium]|nr:response regulator transcription factor [bacterium]